jgi:hypothetical protein
MLARKSLSARFAASAASFASRSDSSARSRSVISMKMTTAPRNWLFWINGEDHNSTGLTPLELHIKSRGRCSFSPLPQKRTANRALTPRLIHAVPLSRSPEKRKHKTCHGCPRFLSQVPAKLFPQSSQQNKVIQLHAENRELRECSYSRQPIVRCGLL